MRKTFLMFAILNIFALQSEAQGYLFTISGDTIRFESLDQTSKIYKASTVDSQKPLKFNSTVISNLIFDPEYAIAINQTDEFEGTKMLYTKTITAGSSIPSTKNVVNLVIWFGKMKDKNEELYIIKLRAPVELGCTGVKGNYVSIKFENGEILNLDKDLADIDCSRNATSIYKLDDTAIELILNNQLKVIRYQKSKSSMDFYTMFPACLSESLAQLVE